MKKLVLTIYHTGISKQYIRFAIRFINSIAGVQMIEILEAEMPDEDIYSNTSH